MCTNLNESQTPLNLLIRPRDPQEPASYAFYHNIGLSKIRQGNLNNDLRNQILLSIRIAKIDIWIEASTQLLFWFEDSINMGYGIGSNKMISDDTHPTTVAVCVYEDASYQLIFLVVEFNVALHLT